MISKAARRYSKALLQSALEQDILDEVVNDVRFVLATVKDSRELTVFLDSPVIAPEEKKQALSSIFDEHISKETRSLLRLLSEKQRENLLQDICLGFIKLYNEHKGIIQVDVTSAFELAEKEKKSLHEALIQSTGKKVEMNVQIDPDIMGGIIVKIDDTVLDGSVRHKIRKLKNQFAVTTAV